ncbi:MAG: DUF4349 domain-containing protein [Pseudomonadota bacterium]
MTPRIWIAAALAAMLAACGGGGNERSQAAPPPPPPPPSPAPALEAFDQAGEFQARSAPSSTPDGVVDPATQYIAYSHALGLRLPVDGVEALVEAHQSACRTAGPKACLITNANVNKQSDDYVSGTLQLRATPVWIEAFMGEIDAAAEEAGGEVTYRQTRAEDLTRQIIDVDARLSAQITLRERLETLLETREGELGELLDIEREYARVTGQIESMTSTLNALRLRVSMSELSINYETKLSPISSSRQNPLGRAFGDFFYNLSEAIAAVITAFAIGLPWLLLLGLLLWIWLRLIWPRIRRKKPS